MSTAQSTRVETGQRFTRWHPCPICDGWDSERRHKGERCWGYLSLDGLSAHCTREEYAGALAQFRDSTYKHSLDGACRCGRQHGAGGLAPRVVPSTAPTQARRQQHGPFPKTLNLDDSVVTLARVFPYRSAAGTPAYSVLRYDYPLQRGETKPEKTFRQVTHLNTTTWAWGLGETERLLYDLPGLYAASPTRPVFIGEGEKVAEALIGLGLLATTCPEGAEKWRQVPGRHDALRNRYVVILADQDEKGRRHAQQVAADLQGVAASVRIVLLPGLPEHGDIVEWIDAGGTKDALYELVIATPVEQAKAVEHNTQEASAATVAADRRASDEVERLRAANVALNARLSWVDRVAAVPSDYLSASAKVAVQVLRRELARDNPRDAAGMWTPYLPTLAKKCNVSAGTLGTILVQLDDVGALKRKEYPDISTRTGKTVTRVAIAPGPAIDTPEEWVPSHVRPKHGGKREGAGRPPKCKSCGSTNVKVIERTIREIRCRGCGEISQEQIGYDRDVTPPETPEEGVL